MPSSRRQFLKTTAVATAAAAMPARWVDAKDLKPGGKLKLRLAVASDLHYGQRNTPFDEMAAELVGWLNAEKQGKGLDLCFLNGDLSHDSSEALLKLRDDHLSKLEVPYFCIKGNHDYVDGKPGSPTESWPSLFGYPANHSFERDGMAFILCDTTVAAKSNVYLAADIEWLKGELEKHKDAAAVFVMIHIQQRKHKVDGWPAHGVHDENEIPKAEAVMKLLESTPNVRAVFHGHNHLETGVYVSGERRYFFDSHAGGSWGAKRGYRIVEVYDDHRMVTYQMNGEDDDVLSRHELAG